MKSTVLTPEEIVRRHANSLAYVTGGTPATDLATLASQLTDAADRFTQAGINGAEELETAALFLNEAQSATSDTARKPLLRRAGSLLRNLGDMTDEYREMVGD